MTRRRPPACAVLLKRRQEHTQAVPADERTQAELDLVRRRDFRASAWPTPGSPRAFTSRSDCESGTRGRSGRLGSPPAISDASATASQHTRGDDNIQTLLTQVRQQAIHELGLPGGSLLLLESTEVPAQRLEDMARKNS